MGDGKCFALPSAEVKLPKIERDFKKISWLQCQCSGSSQIPSQDDLNDYHHFLSLFQIVTNYERTELHIYNTENGIKEVKILDNKIHLDKFTSITQLPNGELFCYGKYGSGITLIIDRNYNIRMLPSGTRSNCKQILYYDNNIYCFGLVNLGEIIPCRRFDLKKNRWVNLAPIPEPDQLCHSVIFNGNILVSGELSKNIWLYSTEIDSFSIIPYQFVGNKIKLLINVERLYLIEWGLTGLIYESEDEYDWKQISKSIKSFGFFQMYCLHNKGKIYISTLKDYYQFDLKEKILSKLKV